jgi:endonuclease G, mitochondrial
MSLLPHDRILEIANAFLALDLGANQVRPVLLLGLPTHFKGLLQDNLPPKPQVLNDLGRMNQIERLADGTVPLKVWLTNAVNLAFGTEHEKVFRRALDDTEHIASGAPRLDLAKLPETKEVIVFRDDLLPFSFLELGVEAARSVAKLRVPSHAGGQPRQISGTPEVHLGTGWLLTPTLLITNHHVVNARKEDEPPAPEADLLIQGAAATAQFGFDGDGIEGQTVQAQKLEAWDATLDYALLRMVDTGRPALRRAARPLIKKDGDSIPVNIVQHPEGTSKKLGIRNNMVTASTDTDLRYFTDTKQGSSGSPVLNDTWEVVALHRGATFAQNVSFQGKNVAYVNIGTHLPSILDDLKSRFPALANEVG